MRKQRANRSSRSRRVRGLERSSNRSGGGAEARFDRRVIAERIDRAVAAASAVWKLSCTVLRRLSSPEYELSIETLKIHQSRSALEIWQATKSVWWMPWRSEAMKGVDSCEKPEGAANRP